MNIADISIIVAASTPLLFAALGELVVEKSGVLNLGVEGMMLMGAVLGFWAAISGYSAFWCFVIAVLAGMSMSFIFAIFTLYLYTNQVATGLAIAILGTGLSSLIGADLVGIPFAGFLQTETTLFAKTPWLHVFVSQDMLAYLAVVLVIAVYWFLNHNHYGLMLRAIGDNHHAAFALGYHVQRIRFFAILFGGLMAGMGGAYMALVSPHIWTLQLTGGRGWIALALVVFSIWKPFNLLLGAYLFGTVSILQYSLQGSGLDLPPQLWTSAPYLMTIFVLVLVSVRHKKGSLSAPSSLGKTFIP